MSLLFRGGALPFTIAEMSSGAFAALPLAQRALYPIAVPLSQICKWYWLSKSISIAASSVWVTSDGSGGSESGSDAFNATVPDANTLAPWNNPRSIFPFQTLGTQAPVQRALGLGGVLTGAFSGYGVKASARGEAFGSSPFLGLQLFSQNAGHNPGFVIKIGSDYFPQIVMVYAAGGIWSSAQTAPGGAGGVYPASLPSGSATLDGLTIPMFADPAFTPTISWTKSLDVEFPTFWTP